MAVIGSNIDMTIAQKLQVETLNTGQGDNLLYAMNQNVRTADAVILQQSIRGRVLQKCIL